MICITRRLLAGMFLALVAGWVGAPSPAKADYQSGVDAYYRNDFQGAYAAWLPLAEAGDAVAQNSIGALYDHGLGFAEDNTEAARWYEMAAQQGLPLAMRNLANQYVSGHGVVYDLEIARQWYERAAAAGDQQSAALLSHLRPASPPPSAAPAEAPAGFDTPSITGSLAEPADAAVPAVMEDATAAATELPLATPLQPAVEGQSVALDVGGQTYNVPLAGSSGPTVEEAPVPSAPPQPSTIQPAVVQQAAIAPAATRSDGNWLIGQWQGPSLGCPAGGGIEFTNTETLSWFDGQVAVRLSSTYRIAGENVFVVTTGADGAPQEYVYQSAGANRMLIVSVPPAMPKSLIGVAYRRCGAQPTMTQQATNLAIPSVPAVVPPAPQATEAAPAPDLSTAAVIATPPATMPEAPSAAPALAMATPAAPVPAVTTTDEGWKAFEQGDYERAVAIFKSLGEAGDSNMQVLVGNIYDYGQGIPQDDVQALQWYLMAAGLGNAKGQFQAGSIYYRSNTVPQDLVESYRWLTLAAEGSSQSLATDPSQSTAIQAQSLRAEVASTMSAADIAKATALAKKTRAKN